jgi:hypothetical protein
MKAILFLMIPAALLLSLAGCADSKPSKEDQSEPEKKVEKAPAPPSKEAKIKANIAKLPTDEQPIAEAQKFCAVEEENRLGSMGMPIKVMIDGQPVFLCCKGCQKAALKDPEKTLAKVKELKEKTKGSAAQ